ncbi:MAG TPA: hypothetical protein VGM56_26380 [Byssovorax sp.]|jgi:hypothetical protein
MKTTTSRSPLASTARLAAAVAVAALASIAFTSACGSDGGGGGAGGGSSCPDDLPTSCPATHPVYADVAPIITQRCDPCHAQGGEEDDRLLETYAEVFAQRQEILTQVYDCLMPNASEGQAPLSATDRATFLQWLVCMSPDQ